MTGANISVIMGKLLFRETLTNPVDPRRFRCAACLRRWSSLLVIFITLVLIDVFVEHNRTFDLRLRHLRVMSLRRQRLSAVPATASAPGSPAPAVPRRDFLARTPISPPMSVTKCLQIERPKPVPPYFLVVDVSA